MQPRTTHAALAGVSGVLRQLVATLEGAREILERYEMDNQAQDADRLLDLARLAITRAALVCSEDRLPARRRRMGARLLRHERRGQNDR